MFQSEKMTQFTTVLVIHEGKLSVGSTVMLKDRRNK